MCSRSEPGPDPHRAPFTIGARVGVSWCVFGSNDVGFFSGSNILLCVFLAGHAEMMILSAQQQHPPTPIFPFLSIFQIHSIAA